MADEPEPMRRPRLCPLCQRPSDPRFRPFCSARCRDQDLLAWLEERYAVPVLEAEADERGEPAARDEDEEH